MIAMPGMSLLTNRDQLLRDIENVSSGDQLFKIFSERILTTDHKNDVEILTFYVSKQNDLHKALEQKCVKISKSVSTFVAPDGKEYTDLDFSGLVSAQIPLNTYLHVKVTTLPEFQFPQSLIKARKIELVREKWGVFKVPFFESIQAVFSSMFKRQSIYRSILESDVLMKGLLASSIIVGDPENRVDSNGPAKEKFEHQLTAAYWTGKSIEIIVPFDFSENGVISWRSESKLLAYSIDSGRFLRSLVTNT